MTAGQPDLTPPDTLGQTNPPPRAVFFHQRTVDSVRACALGNAVEAVRACWNPGAMEPFQHTDEILRVARRFEAYLTGKEEVTPDA